MAEKKKGGATNVGLIASGINLQGDTANVNGPEWLTENPCTEKGGQQAHVQLQRWHESALGRVLGGIYIVTIAKKDPGTTYPIFFRHLATRVYIPALACLSSFPVTINHARIIFGPFRQGALKIYTA